jgi:membrane protease YdiL (CAAX protease family)
MTLFALALPSTLMFVGQATFTLYVLLSFVVVARYAARKIMAGRLIDGRAAPVKLSIPPSGQWLFNFNVVAILFVQSPYYVVVALTAIIIFLAVDERLVKDHFSLQRAGAWLFIANVIALLLTQSPLYMLLIVIGQAVLLAENRRTAQRQFGLERLSLAQLTTWSLLICGAVIVLAAPLMQIFELALDALHLSHPEQQSVEVFRQVTRRSQIVDFLIQAVVLAPMIEELFFRGFLLTYLKNHMSTWVALIVSAGIFAIAHQNLDSVLPLWLLGIVLGVAYEHTGSILLPMGIHACFNLTTGLTLLAQRASS